MSRLGVNRAARLEVASRGGLSLVVEHGSSSVSGSEAVGACAESLLWWARDEECAGALLEHGGVPCLVWQCGLEDNRDAQRFASEALAWLARIV